MVLGPTGKGVTTDNNCLGLWTSPVIVVSLKDPWYGSFSDLRDLTLLRRRPFLLLDLYHESGTVGPDGSGRRTVGLVYGGLIYRGEQSCESDLSDSSQGV